MTIPVIVVIDSKYASDTKQRGFNLTPFSTQYWRPGMVVPAGYCIRPAPTEMAEALGYDPRVGPDGYQYRASIVDGGTLGQTGKKEPKFGELAQTDGSVTWTREPLSIASLFRSISAPASIEWESEDGEIVISSADFVVGVELHVVAHQAGGVEGSVHRVVTKVPYSDGTIEHYARDWTILVQEAGA